MLYHLYLLLSFLKTQVCRRYFKHITAYQFILFFQTIQIHKDQTINMPLEYDIYYDHREVVAAKTKLSKHLGIEEICENNTNAMRNNIAERFVFLSLHDSHQNQLPRCDLDWLIWPLPVAS